MGQQVVFGVRPEDIQDARRATDHDPGHRIRATIEVVEPMGAEIFVYLNTGRNTFIARLGAHDEAAVDQQIELVINLQKAHFFDAGSGEVLV